MSFKDQSWLILSMALRSIISAITPELKKDVVDALAKWEEKAKQTANPFDDCLVKFLQLLLL
jgi:hypothetical protein